MPLIDTIMLQPGTPAAFWHAINLLITKPHVVNRRLWGCKIWIELNCKPVNTSTWEIPAQFNRLKSTVTAENVKDYIDIVLRDAELEICSQEVSCFQLYLVQLYSKKFDTIQVFQLILINKEKFYVAFHNVSPEIVNQNSCPTFPFTLKLDETCIKLSACCGSYTYLPDSSIRIQCYHNHTIQNVIPNCSTFLDEADKSFKWLSCTLLPQVVKWYEEEPSSSSYSLCKESLALVPHNQYYIKYNELKIKYGKDMVKVIILRAFL